MMVSISGKSERKALSNEVTVNAATGSYAGSGENTAGIASLMLMSNDRMVLWMVDVVVTGTR